MLEETCRERAAAAREDSCEEGPNGASRGGGLVSPHARRVLAAHQYQGRTNDCGPFAAAMILNALTGSRLDGGTLAREMDLPRRSGVLPILRRIPGHATFPWGLVDILRARGLYAWWKAMSRERDLRSCLVAGCLAVPIIGSWRHRWAHYAVLVAWQPGLGYGFADPGRGGGAVVWIRSAEFARRWTSFGRTAVYVRLARPGEPGGSVSPPPS